MQYFRAALFIAFSLSFPYSLHAADKGPLTALKTYSDLGFNKVEGEYYGLQISVIPYSGGKKILWREGSGRLEAPLLLNVIETRDTLTVYVPDSSQSFGEWTFTYSGKNLIAVGPRGLRFELKPSR